MHPEPAPRPVPEREPDASARPILTAELLSIGTELTVGETLDTNAGEIARALVGLGVRVTRVQALPDELDAVTTAFRDGLARSDLVVSTGGLGPTPDDLTREAVAAAVAETPTVDPELLAWLHGLWARRGIPFPDANAKQAWRIPSSQALPNPNGTAPGWWVDRPDGRVVVTLPGPPREMRPMWSDEVLPRLRARGAGRSMTVRTLRLTGIGESQVADRLGEPMLRASNPSVATYARADAVDVRISAVDERAEDGRILIPADVHAAEAEAAVVAAVGDHVWARGSTTWAEAIDDALAQRGLTLATTETGTRGAFATLLAETTRLTRAEIANEEPQPDEDPGEATPHLRPELATAATQGDQLAVTATELRTRAGTAVAVALRAWPRGSDMGVSVAIATADGVRRARRPVFLSGAQGRHRAALAAAGVLLLELRRTTEPGAP